MSLDLFGFLYRHGCGQHCGAAFMVGYVTLQQRHVQSLDILDGVYDAMRELADIHGQSHRAVLEVQVQDAGGTVLRQFPGGDCRQVARQQRCPTAACRAVDGNDRPFLLCNDADLLLEPDQGSGKLLLIERELKELVAASAHASEQKFLRGLPAHHHNGRLSPRLRYQVNRLQGGVGRAVNRHDHQIRLLFSDSLRCPAQFHERHELQLFPLLERLDYLLAPFGARMQYKDPHLRHAFASLTLRVLAP